MSAAERFMPRFEESPYSARSIQSQYQPMYGSYLLADPFGADENPITGEVSDFQSYVKQRLGADPYEYRQAPLWAELGGREGTTKLLDNWKNVVRAAQAQGNFATRGEGDAYSPYEAVMQDAQGDFDLEKVRALESLATYRPGIGSIYGDIRKGALARVKRGWETANPLGSQVDWLGYLGSGFKRGGPDVSSVYGDMLRRDWTVT
jgi:hypothetical protein